VLVCVWKYLADRIATDQIQALRLTIVRVCIYVCMSAITCGLL